MSSVSKGAGEMAHWVRTCYANVRTRMQFSFPAFQRPRQEIPGASWLDRLAGVASSGFCWGSCLNVQDGEQLKMTPAIHSESLNTRAYMFTCTCTHLCPHTGKHACAAHTCTSHTQTHPLHHLTHNQTSKESKKVDKKQSHH